MKELNQIILCSQTKGRSYLRELAVFDEFAVVTNIERLPFRFHELLGKKRAKDELVVKLEVPVRKTASHKGCPYCGQGTIFQCSHCGFLSCSGSANRDHHCPGCDKTYKSKAVSGTLASESGFINMPSANRSDGNRWGEAQAALLGLIKHQNNKPN